MSVNIIIAATASRFHQCDHTPGRPRQKTTAHNASAGSASGCTNRGRVAGINKTAAAVTTTPHRKPFRIAASRSSASAETATSRRQKNGSSRPHGKMIKSAQAGPVSQSMTSNCLKLKRSVS